MRPFLRREAIAIKRNLGLVVLLLIVLPGGLVAGTLIFDQTIPEDVPVGVVPAEDSTTDAELAVVEAGVTMFATPVDYEDSDRAREGLEREEIYLLIEVPNGLLDPNESVTVTLVSDQTFVPFQEPANISTTLIDVELGNSVPANVTVDHERLGDSTTLSEYLVAVGLLAYVVVFAMLVVPHQLRNERSVIDRIQTDASMAHMVAAKVLFFGAVLVVPIAVVGFVSDAFGMSVGWYNPLSISTLMLTYVFLVGLSISVMILLGLRRSGLYVNAGLAAVVFVGSSFLFPVGFFSSARKTIARSVPTHYSVITTRGGMLRDAAPSLYTDYLIGLGIAAIVALAILVVSLRTYERRK